MDELERRDLSSEALSRPAITPAQSSFSFGDDPRKDALIATLGKLDLDEMPPRQAQEALYTLRSRAREL